MGVFLSICAYEMFTLLVFLSIYGFMRCEIFGEKVSLITSLTCLFN